MTASQIEMRVSMYSTETLHEIVVSTNRRWVWFKLAAKRELTRRAA